MIGTAKLNTMFMICLWEETERYLYAVIVCFYSAAQNKADNKRKGKENSEAEAINIEINKIPFEHAPLKDKEAASIKFLSKQFHGRAGFGWIKQGAGAGEARALSSSRKRHQTTWDYALNIHASGAFEAHKRRFLNVILFIHILSAARYASL